MTKRKIERLPIGMVYNASTDEEYRDVFIEIPKNSHFINCYTQDGIVYSISSYKVVIQWKKKWK